MVDFFIFSRSSVILYTGRSDYRRQAWMVTVFSATCYGHVNR